MNVFTLLTRELFYRKANSIVILLTVFVASSVSVAIYTLSKASEDETRKIMREQGLNLFIYPKGTDLIDLFSINSENTFPESYIDTLANTKTFDAVRHLTGILQIRYPDWVDPNGSSHRIILAGYKDEAMQRFLAPQEIMGFDVEPGTAQVGSLIARNIPEGEKFIIKGLDGKMYSYEITKRFEEGRGMLDQGVALNLHDLQQITGLPGQINKIEALGCVCADGRINNARKQVREIFADLEVTELTSIADARENQRLMMNKYGSFIIPFVIVTALLISGLLFFNNINARRNEIGLLKAMGNSYLTILILITGKALLLGFAGSIAGFFAGTFFAGYFGKEIFRFTAMNIRPVWSLFYFSIVFFPVLWALSSWIPALKATQVDPARTLSEE